MASTKQLYCYSTTSCNLSQTSFAGLGPAIILTFVIPFGSKGLFTAPRVSNGRNQDVISCNPATGVF